VLKGKGLGICGELVNYEVLTEKRRHQSWESAEELGGALLGTKKSFSRIDWNVKKIYWRHWYGSNAAKSKRAKSGPTLA
jgi:hypothetical protein